MKKYIMALTGLILVGFVVGHMLGNLQMFLHPDWINEYAYKLHNLPYGLLWIVRIVLLVTVLAHIWTAVLLVMENRRAKSLDYTSKNKIQASFASKTMKYSGIVILAFVVFHILHFTVQSIHPEFKTMETQLEGVGTIHHVAEKLQAMGKDHVHDVYSMVAIGFSKTFWYVSVFYVVAMVLLCIHLSHGISSMFQSVGLRNKTWRLRLDRVAMALSVIVFIGFVSIPICSLLGILPYQSEVADWEAIKSLNP